MALDKNEIIERLQSLAIELGRSPTRDEVCHHFQTTIYGLNLMGGHSALLNAAGLKPISNSHVTKLKRQEISQAFERDPADRLEEYIPAQRSLITRTKTVLVLGDTHFPWIHKASLERVIQIANDIKPDVIIRVGDLYDMFSMGKFPRSHNVYTPREEMRLAREGAEEMWRRLRAAAPMAELHQIRGNHDSRPYKKIIGSAPELEDFIEAGIKPMFIFDGVKTHFDDRAPLIIDGVYFTHGWSSSLGAHRDRWGQSTVCGHSHRLGVSFRTVADDQGRERTIFEANAGLLGDPPAKCFEYTPSKITGFTLGCLIIDPISVRAIPF